MKKEGLDKKRDRSATIFIIRRHCVRRGKQAFFDTIINFI